MPYFKFRLLAALRLAERNHEEEQRKLAVQVQKLQILEQHYAKKEILWQEALEGQKNAGRVSPQDLGLWQLHAQHLLEGLRLLAEEVKVQEEAVLVQRECLANAYQEVEKLDKLRERQKEEYDREALRQEQIVLDEAGQVIFYKKQGEPKAPESSRG